MISQNFKDRLYAIRCDMKRVEAEDVAKQCAVLAGLSLIISGVSLGVSIVKTRKMK